MGRLGVANGGHSMIVGDKVYLSSVERGNIEILRHWRNRPSLRKYFREFKEISKLDQESWFFDCVVKDQGVKQIDFEVHDKASGVLIGHCGLYYISWVNRTAELSVYIGDMDFRGGGYGKDALTMLFDYAFYSLNLNRIFCEVYDNNESIHVYRHMGFKDEGVLKQSYYCDGKFGDSHILGLLRGYWDERRDEI